MKHFIGKQIIELKLNSSNEAWKKQARLSRLYWDRIVPVLEAIFDRYSIDGQVIKIDQLVIDLGSISESELRKGSFMYLLQKKLEDQLANVIHESNSKIFTIPLLTRDFDKWIYFLEFGYFPWSIPLPDSNWHRNVLDAMASESSAINNLQTLLQNQVTAQNRLIRQHKPDFLKIIIELFTARNQDLLIDFMAKWFQFTQLKSSVEHIPDKLRQKESYWLHHFSVILPYRPHLSAEELIKQLLVHVIDQSSHEIISTIDIFLSKEFPVIKKSMKFASSDKELKNIKKDHSTNAENFNQSTTKSNKVLGEKPLNNAFSKSVSLKKSNIEERPNKNAQRNTNQVDLPIIHDKLKNANQEEIYDQKLKEGDALYINNAGVILIHPFLNRFFKKGNLIENSNFINISCQHKAIYLIHYLATKSLVEPEYGLVLPKILCGLALNVPLNNRPSVGSELLLEAENLLEAAIDHWGVLGKSSVDGLREGFLQREGKLEKHSTGLKLTVEKKTIDILLDQLPWNLGLIKLPWMTELLKVDWR